MHTNISLQYTHPDKTSLKSAEMHSHSYAQFSEFAGYAKLNLAIVKLITGLTKAQMLF